MDSMRAFQSKHEWACFFFLFVPFVLFVAPSSATEPTYWQDIRPILRKHCTVCHNVKNLKEDDVSGGLALDSLEALLKGKHGRVVRAGKSGESLMIKMITAGDESRRMPKDAPPLPSETISLIRHWIDGGAKEGTKIDTDIPAPTSASARRTRRLDVILHTEAVPPKGLLGQANPGKLELALKVGPLAPVVAVAFSPDGKWLAAGSYGRVTVWELPSARPTKVLTNVLGAVNDVRFSPDGRLLAAAGGQPSAKGDLRLYQVSDWKLLAELGGHTDVVFSVAFSPDSKRLASASFDKTVKLWGLTDHKLERTYHHHSDIVYSVAFSPDGRSLVSGSKDRSVKVIDTNTGKSRFTFSGLEQDVLTVAVSPDGQSVVSSGLEPGLHWWNSQTGERVRVQNGHGTAVHELCFSKDGKHVVSGGADQTVRIWNGGSGGLERTMTAGSVVYAVAISPDGKWIASGSFDGLVRLWDAGSGRLLVTLLDLPPDKDNLEWLALTPEGFETNSPGLAGLYQWRMSGQVVGAEPIRRALEKPDLVAKAIRGEKLATPTFGK
jgi:Tol biopolymer transport system component